MGRVSALCVVEHRFQKPAQSALILFGDLSILLKNFRLFRADAPPEKTPAIDDVQNVNAQFSNSVEVCSVWIPGPALIASLRVSIHASRLGQILLIEVQSDPFFAQPIPHRSFGR
ncbi:hypothetical protein D3C77_106510 [compost metagenome]